ERDVAAILVLEMFRVRKGWGGRSARRDAPNAGAQQVARLDRRATGSSDGRLGGAQPSLARFTHIREANLSTETRIVHLHRPPAMAGAMLTSSPAFSSVPSPSRKRMSSSPT